MTKLGKLVLTLVVLAVAGIAVYNWGFGRKAGGGASPADVGEAHGSAVAAPVPSSAGAGAASAALEEFAFVDPPPQVERLPAAQTYQMQGDTIVIELSEYAGYAGLIVANNGLEPNEDSFFFRNHGFKVKFTISEADSWPSLQGGQLAATATTVDVLACYGRQFQAVVPAQIAFSRGADGIIVRSEIRRVNDLKGRILAAAPYNETEFFVRYLAQEAGLRVVRLSGPGQQPDPEAVNLVFCEDAFVAGDAFLADVQGGGDTLAGCVTWAPKTTEIVEASGGKARQLIDNRNLLVISDILIFNKGFADAHPEIVKGVVHGLIHGNGLVRRDPARYHGAIAEAFREYEWTAEDAESELAKVHLSNLPENLAFFSGATDASGSFESIYQSSVLAYGPDIVPNPAPPDYFVDIAALEALQASGEFADQQVAIRPVKTTDRSPVENDPLLSRDIRFFFEPNSAELDAAAAENDQFLEAIWKMLQVSPGSVIVLRGHVDDAMIGEFRRQGGEALVRSMALKAMQLSKDRAETVRRHLAEKFPAIQQDRLEVIGRGWEEPTGPDSELNRRVEVQWFTIE